MVIFKKIYKQNLIQIYTKTHQIAQFKKEISRGGGGACPRTPLAKHLATCKFPNLPPPCQILGTPL